MSFIFEFLSYTEVCIVQLQVCFKRGTDKRTFGEGLVIMFIILLKIYMDSTFKEV